jgi:hypothetical protein
MVKRSLRAAGYLLLAFSLAQCASLGRRASLAYTAIAAQLAPDEVRVQIDRSFVEAYKDRVTIDATFTVDEASPSPNPIVFDGDLHFAGRAPEIGLRMVGEIKNAREVDAAVALVQRAAKTRQPIKLTGAWRIWAEHSLGRPEEQGRPLARIETPHPEHVFEIHPIIKLGSIGLLQTLHPVEGYKPGGAKPIFGSYQGAKLKLRATPTTVTFDTPTWLYNDVHFLMELTEAGQQVVSDGRFVTARVLDLDGNLLVEQLRMVFVKGSAPEQAVSRLSRGGRLHLWGLPRLDFAEISRRVRASPNPSIVDEGPMPYEIIVVGVYPDQL